MKESQFDVFFRTATGSSPYPYQCRLACGSGARLDDVETLKNGRMLESQLVHIPTGLGKTAAVVLAWLWNRSLAADRWPRRLVYCLPMRTLVEQTARAVSTWLLNLHSHVDWIGLNTDFRSEIDLLLNRSPVVLMGGEDVSLVQRDWDVYPERPAIILGTQDMLLSRALNRGYGMSRYRWPMHFALLNNDCLWVFDEVQLMGAGLSTTSQLESFRSSLGCNQSASMWMSATLQRDWLKTVDFPAPERLPIEVLSENDLRNDEVNRRWTATKRVQRARASMDTFRDLADEIIQVHREKRGLTLVIINTVARARELMSQIESRTRSIDEKPDLVLLHSRFRPEDRQKQVDRFLSEPGAHGMIAVCTQVVEAGVDVSARTLFTELAPWSSMVQRFGRCNRNGVENENATVFWVDLSGDDKQREKLALPYGVDDLLESIRRLGQLQEVSPSSLARLNGELPYKHNHVIRRKDLIELFDTTPDLAGNDIDIERYIRDVEECDVQVFWRDWSGDSTPPEEMSGPDRNELCSVPAYEFRDGFLRDSRRRRLTYRWDHLDGRWMIAEMDRVFPGQTYLVHAAAGGYLPERGWDIGFTRPVPLCEHPVGTKPQSNDDEPWSESVWQSIAEHTDDGCRELETILSALELKDPDVLRKAMRWHDRGKAHASFPAKLKVDALETALATGLLNGDHPAKAPREAWVRGRNNNECYRKRFRHELASALAVLMADEDLIDPLIRDLVAYLVAAHHGKVRLSIRSLPEEKVPPDDRRFARGIWDDDNLSATRLGGNVIAPPVSLSLELMELGLCEQPPFKDQPSWIDRMIRLRDDPALGPFRLAYLESILRAADMRASRIEPQPGA